MMGYMPNRRVISNAPSASFTPTDLPNLFAWYKFNTGITIATGVSQWDDQSGNARHLTQVTGANQPANSSGTITFDGVSDFLANTFGASSQPKTLCLRIRPLNHAGGVFDGGVAGVDSMAFNWSGTGQQFEIYASGGGTVVDTNMTASAWNSVICVFDGASSSTRVGANADNTGNPGTAAISGLLLGASEGTGFSNFDIREFIVYSDNKGSSDKTTLMTYLNGI